MSQAKTLISLVYYLACLPYRATLRLLGRDQPRLIVLYYHAVPDHAQPGFARQMATLASHANIVRLHPTSPLDRRRPNIAITFDDAFDSVRRNAVPVLAEHSAFATIFAPAQNLGEEPKWQMSECATDAREIVMTAEALRALPSTLIDIGSHTLTHPRCSTLDDQALLEELRGSKTLLEELLDRPVRTLAFPYGDRDARVVEACRGAGYERVFSILAIPIAEHETGFVWGRVSVEPSDGTLTFFLKYRGAYAWMPSASRLKRFLRG